MGSEPLTVAAMQPTKKGQSPKQSHRTCEKFPPVTLPTMSAVSSQLENTVPSAAREPAPTRVKLEGTQLGRVVVEVVDVVDVVEAALPSELDASVGTAAPPSS